VLLSLTACGAARQPLIRTEIVELPVVTYAALPSALTEALAKPSAPPRNCRDQRGQPAVCAFDGLLYQVDQDKVIDRCNDDRASAFRITSAADLIGRDGGEQP
jgi:hypothetical protein